jgi:hypothetical protein
MRAPSLKHFVVSGQTGCPRAFFVFQLRVVMICDRISFLVLSGVSTPRAACVIHECCFDYKYSERAIGCDLRKSFLPTRLFENLRYTKHEKISHHGFHDRLVLEEDKSLRCMHACMHA